MVGFSPAIVFLARDLIDHPEIRFTLLSPLLLALALRSRAAEPAERRQDGLVAIGLGVAMQVLGVFTQTWFIAELGLPVAALGLARWAGRPPIAVIALLFFAIPPPDSVVLLLSPALETRVAQATGATLRSIGFPVEARGFWLVAKGGRIEFERLECGVTMAYVLSALGWYSSVAGGRGLGSAALRAGLSCLVAIPLQLVVTLISGALLAIGLRGIGQFWLSQGAWIATSLVGVAWLQHRTPNARSSGLDQRSARIQASG
jgi:hypothetical protein